MGIPSGWTIAKKSDMVNVRKEYAWFNKQGRFSLSPLGANDCDDCRIVGELYIKYNVDKRWISISK